MLRYSENLSPFAVGRRVNSEEWNAITRTFEAADEDARLGFGQPVRPGTDKHSCAVMIATTAQNFLGITEAVAVLPRAEDAFAQHDNVPICESGVIAVPVEGDVTKGAVARWNSATGNWTAAAQSATVVTIPGCTFEETATAPGVTPVRLRRPNPALTVSGTAD